MLDLIEAELYMVANTRGYTQKLLKAVANSILNMQEEAGMLPPHYMYRGNLYDVQSRVGVKCIWEPEDEKE